MAVVEAIQTILADPIGFLKNLFNGVKQGLDNFVTNIKTHLITGLVEWLTGSLGGVSITIPDNLFSLSGVFSLVGQVLGLSWDYFRAKAVKKLGEPIVKGSGPAGLNIKGWNYVEAIPNGPNNWVRFHLLNENLHGPGAQFNLVPTTVDDNNTFKTDFENNAKKAVNAQNKIIRYNVKVYYHSSGGPSHTSIEEFKSIFKYFPKKIIASAEEVTFDRQKNNWKKTSGFAPKPWIRTFPTPFNLDQLPLSLYSLDAYQMNKWLGLNQDFVSLIRDVLLEDRPENPNSFEEYLAIKGDSHSHEKIRSKWEGWYTERLLPLLEKGEDGGVTLKK